MHKAIYGSYYEYIRNLLYVQASLPYIGHNKFNHYRYLAQRVRQYEQG